jgi:hypothetical protein
VDDELLIPRYATPFERQYCPPSKPTTTTTATDFIHPRLPQIHIFPTPLPLSEPHRALLRRHTVLTPTYPYPDGSSTNPSLYPLLLSPHILPPHQYQADKIRTPLPLSHTPISTAHTTYETFLLIHTSTTTPPGSRTVAGHRY